MNKFKVGDVVRFKGDRNRLTGFLADAQSDLLDRTISGEAYDAIVDALENRKPMVVAAVDEEFGYEVRVGAYGMPGLMDDEDIELTVLPPVPQTQWAAILEANPVLKEPGYADKQARWNKLKEIADAQGLSREDAIKFIAAGMLSMRYGDGPTGFVTSHTTINQGNQ